MITRKRRGRCVTSPRLGAARRRAGQRQCSSLKTHVCSSDLGGSALQNVFSIGRFKLQRKPRTARLQKQDNTQERAVMQQQHADDQRAAAKQSFAGRVRTFFAKEFRKVAGV